MAETVEVENVSESADVKDMKPETNSEENFSTTNGESSFDKQTLLAVLSFLKKNNLKETEIALKKEACFTDDDNIDNAKFDISVQLKTEVAPVVPLYRCDGNPLVFEEQYIGLRRFIESSLDMHKSELEYILYPLFVHVYLKLVVGGCEEQAKSFFENNSLGHDECFTEDMQQLALVTKAEHIRGCQLAENFRCTKYAVRMSHDSYVYLKHFLTERNMTSLLSVLQEHLAIDVFDGIPRTKAQISAKTGSMLGDQVKEVNKTKVFYGLLKEPDLNIHLDDEDDDAAVTEDGKSSKKRKAKKDSQSMKKSKTDPNAPQLTRIPLPELKDSDKLEKALAAREISKKVNLGPEVHPSVLFYTFLNSFNSVTSVDICEDASLMSAGFADSVVRVWSLNSSKLCSIKTPEELAVIDKELDDVLDQAMDDHSATDTRTLLGHSGAVYSTSFSPDKNYMVSSSEDGTVRLWSTYTWSNLVSYKGHVYPVWSVKYGPRGHYFVSAGYDRTARLWSTDHNQPLRIFAGHHADVECVDFHPNSNYVVTGSVDRTVRLWDVMSGNCVRMLTGHKAPVTTTTFSPDGRYLASAGRDANIMIWDVGTGELVTQLQGHSDCIYSLDFSREGSVLASGGRDNTIILWDMSKITDGDGADAAMPSDAANDGRSHQILSLSTKATNVHCVHFNRRNVLLAAGPFVPV